MRCWIWKLIQVILISIYVVLQILLYYKMNNRLDTALLRIKNLEVLLDERTSDENILTTGRNPKTARNMAKKVPDVPKHEHARLKRYLLESRDIQLDGIMRRLQFVESSILTNNTSQARQHCLRGPPGLQGLPGRDGLPGNTGPPGREGRIGPPGRDGRPCANGRDGIAGRDGMPGRDGVQGMPGRNGVPGPRGDTGDIGPPGPQGIKGRRGKKGDAGPRGPPGPPGSGFVGPPVTGSSTRVTPSPTEADKTQYRPRKQLGGGVYIRWGREDCPGKGSLLVYKGQMAGPSSSEGGSGSNYLCMPHQPFYARAPNPLKSRAHLYGVEYGLVDDIFLRVPGRSRDMNYHGVPCAVCRALSRPSLIMIPARYVCPSRAWTREYHGYLMSSTSNSSKAEYICVDADAGVAQQTGNERTRKQSLLTGVRGKCGTLPCPRYRQDWDLTCAVCTA